MGGPDGTWLVLVRDVSEAIHIRGESQLAAGLILDLETGLLRGVAVAPTDREALTQAFAGAVTKLAGPLPPGLPDTVLCGPGLAEAVGEGLAAVLDESAQGLAAGPADADTDGHNPVHPGSAQRGPGRIWRESAPLRVARRRRVRPRHERCWCRQAAHCSPEHQGRRSLGSLVHPRREPWRRVRR